MHALAHVPRAAQRLNFSVSFLPGAHVLVQNHYVKALVRTVLGNAVVHVRLSRTHLGSAARGRALLHTAWEGCGRAEGEGKGGEC